MSPNEGPRVGDGYMWNNEGQFLLNFYHGPHARSNNFGIASVVVSQVIVPQQFATSIYR